MSKYIKLEDAIKCVNNIHHLADFIRKAICEEIEDIPSADVVERERYDRLKRNFKDLSDDYDELTKKLERAEMRSME